MYFCVLPLILLKIKKINYQYLKSTYCSLDFHSIKQTYSQGSASGCDAPTANLGICSMSKTHADHPAKKFATPYRIHVWPLLNCRCCKELVLKNIGICKMLLCSVLERIM